MRLIPSNNVMSELSPCRLSYTSHVISHSNAMCIRDKRLRRAEACVENHELEMHVKHSRSELLSEICWETVTPLRFFWAKEISYHRQAIKTVGGRGDSESRRSNCWERQWETLGILHIESCNGVCELEQAGTAWMEMI